MSFVIRWDVPYGPAYVTNRSPNRKPYAQTPTDPDTKVWKTRGAAERFLQVKDPGFASQCVIEEIGNKEE